MKRSRNAPTKFSWTCSGSVACCGTRWPSALGRKLRARAAAIAFASILPLAIFTWTEIYIALRAFAGAVEDGLYHYRADRHAVELRSPGAWTQLLASALELPWAAQSPLIIGLNSIFWRESWKYGDRAYRYCCHDLGHAMMSLLMPARALGLPGGTVAHFSDLRLVRALGLSQSDEAPMAFLVFPMPISSREFPAPYTQPVAGVPNVLSEEEVRNEMILGIHAATILPDPAGLLPPHVSMADPDLT